MKKHITSCICFLLTAFSLSGLHAEESEPHALEGTWQAKEIIENGEKMEEELMKSITMRISGDTLIISMGDMEMTGSVTVDDTKDPKWMDVTFTEDGHTETFPSIYKIEGNQLIFCHPDDEDLKERPEAFKSGEELVLATFVREEKAKENQKPDVKEEEK